MKKYLLSIVACTVLSSTILAQTINGLNNVGFESSARGGVSTTSSSAYSMFNNPATLNSGKYFSNIGLNFNVGYRENGLLGTMLDLSDLDIDSVFDSIEGGVNGGTAPSVDARNSIIDAQNIIRGANGNSVNIFAGTSFGFNIGNWGLGVNTQGTVVGSITTSAAHTRLIFERDGNYAEYDPSNGSYTAIIGPNAESIYESSSLEYAVNNGLHFAAVKYHLLTEVPLSYSHNLGRYSQSLAGLTIGTSLKYMMLQTSEKEIRINEDDELTEDFPDSEKANTIGLDLGFLYENDSYDFVVGLSAKNLNAPSFKTDNFEYEIDPSIKIGLSKGFFDDDLKFAVDYDITENESSFTGIQEQHMGLGLSYEPSSWISLNGGVKQNISDWASETNNDYLIYSAGVSFGFKWFQLGISAEISSDTTDVEGDAVPRYASINFGLIGKFGETAKRVSVDE